MFRFTHLLSALGLASASLIAPAPAHAVGRLIDVQVIDRSTGASLPVYRHRGEYWVAGQPGVRYAIEVRNTTSQRLLGVMAVDGVNILTGETADWNQSGYVLDSWRHAQITGWRKSETEVATFHFTALPDSYAARTGRPDNVGVIGVAVFRERPVPPPAPPTAQASPQADRSAMNESAGSTAERPTESERQVNGSAARSPSAAAAPAAPRVGTGHGARERSDVTHTQFERQSTRPDEVIVVRYDSRERLVALGIIPRPLPHPNRPDAFPGASEARYVPDPPRR